MWRCSCSKRCSFAWTRAASGVAAGVSPFAAAVEVTVVGVVAARASTGASPACGTRVPQSGQKRKPGTSCDPQLAHEPLTGVPHA